MLARVVLAWCRVRQQSDDDDVDDDTTSPPATYFGYVLLQWQLWTQQL
jgi:hypothetical protein